MNMILPEISITSVPFDKLLFFLVLALGALLKHMRPKEDPIFASRVIPLVLIIVAEVLEFGLHYKEWYGIYDMNIMFEIASTAFFSTVFAIGTHSGGKNIFCNGAFTAYLTGHYDELIEGGFDQFLQIIGDKESNDVTVVENPLNNTTIEPPAVPTEEIEQELIEMAKELMKIAKPVDELKAEISEFIAASNIPPAETSEDVGGEVLTNEGE